MKKALVLLGFILCIACEKSPTGASTDYSNYFPLERLNTWNYQSLLSSATQTLKIWDTQIINNRIYSTWGTEVNNSVPLYYANGKIYRAQNNEIILWLDFTKKDDETYTYKASPNMHYTVQVTHNVTVECSDTPWENCVTFSFDVASMEDEEISYTLAPNIGIVKITSVWVNWCLSDWNVQPAE